jgi:hypothetical protein
MRPGCWPRSIRRWRYGLGPDRPGIGCLPWDGEAVRLASIVGPLKQPVMRDRYFQPTRPLSEYVRLAQENGSITD